ncbi:calcium-binding protein [Jannaschia sp. 2305UL9-9]|uniref:calcium-binding protein n=1 Tax=Jannaschia sp. 2305UL9-9 TaxID=3121638 RepID=UPI0035276BA7
MANPGTNFASFGAFLNDADDFYAVNFSALNSSGVDGSAILAVGDADDGSRVLNISLSAEGLAPSIQHAQHIHGLFDDDGNPADATTPTILDDADLDGMVEVIEGFGKYGDIILTLLGSDGALPFADANGDLAFFASYDLGNDDLFFSPFGNDYTSEDLMPLTLREIVLHGVEVPTGIGAGTDGEVDGTQSGVVPILPAAAGEIEAIDRTEAFDILDDQFDMSSITTALTRGDDTFDGGAGDDRIYGGPGDDTLLGGANDDTVEGGAGSDVVSGGTGNDRIDGGARDTNAENAADAKAAGSLTIDDYDNAYAGGAGDDTINGGAGDDIITGDDESRVATATGETFDAMADGSDMIFGGAGNDEIHVGSWADGDDGFENTHTGMMDDFANGQDGNDILIGDGGNDTLLGEAGADTIVAGGGADAVSGGAGNDLINAGSDTDNAENAADAKAAGSLSIDDYDNAYAGGAGDDTINGGAGDDIITGDDESRVATATGETFDPMADGSDMIFGGAGNDEIHVGSWADGDDGFGNTHTGSGADFASGGDGNDILIGDSGTDTLRGDAGDDTIKAGGGADFVDGGTGDDDLDAGDGFDIVYGGAGDDTVAGGAGGDTLVGQDGDDVLSGGSSGDLLVGGAGDDFINGGFGNDRINTGSGADKVFHAGVEGHGTDFVQDFDGASDTFVFGGDATATADDFLVQYAMTANAGDAGIEEAFVTYEPTGQILWALIDGADQTQINVTVAGETFDLLA